MPFGKPLTNRSRLAVLYGFIVIIALVIIYQTQNPTQATNEYTWTKKVKPDAKEALGPLTAEKINQSLARVLDPELNLNVIELGLIYDMKVVDRTVTLLMTLTTPSCPFSKTFIDSIKKELLTIPELSKINLKLTFDPPWTLERLTPQIRSQLMGLGPDHIHN